MQQTIEAEFRNWLVSASHQSGQLERRGSVAGIRYLIPLSNHYNKPISAEATYRIDMSVYG